MKLITTHIHTLIVSGCLLCCSFLASAQVGINTTSPSDAAALDISSSDQGFLMTQVALTGSNDLTTITPAPTTGLLVYNTADAGAPGVEVMPGYYFFDGTSWKRFFTQGYTLSYEQTAAATASTTNTTYTVLPGLDTGDITVPFSGTYQIRAEAFYSAGDLLDTAGDGATQGSISLAMSSGAGSGGGATPCTGGISSFPYVESFESGLGAWTQSTADNINWTRNLGGTPSSGTGPSAAFNGVYYLYMEATNNSFNRAIINSPCFDLTTSPFATFSFNYHMRGNNTGSLALEVSIDNGGSWSTVWSKSGEQGNDWLTQDIDLSAYVGSAVQLRFNGIIGNGFRSDMAIDNLRLTETFTPGAGPALDTLKETYLTTSSKRLGGTTINNLAQSGSILVNIDLIAGTTYRFAMRGREWRTRNVSTGSFGKDTSGYTGNNSINNAQRGEMTISLIRQF